MDTTRNYYSEFRQILCDITYMWNIKYDINEPIYETDSWT